MPKLPKLQLYKSLLGVIPIWQNVSKQAVYVTVIVPAMTHLTLCRVIDAGLEQQLIHRRRLWQEAVSDAANG